MPAKVNSMALRGVDVAMRDSVPCADPDEERRRKRRVAHRAWIAKQPPGYRAALMKRLYMANPGRQDEYQRRYQYGLQKGEYAVLLAKQGGLCAICGREETARSSRGIKQMTVDHDHKTGKVRGLLCNNCNAGIGYLKDDPDVLERAAAYVRIGKDR